MVLDELLIPSRYCGPPRSANGGYTAGSLAHELTGTDPVTVTVRLHAEDDDVVMRVIDRGIGIPVAEQDRLFSRFFRSSLAVADQVQGTGLGLALVQSVVEWHDGTVEVESAEGEGTTVVVRLPRA